MTSPRQEILDHIASNGRSADRASARVEREEVVDHRTTLTEVSASAVIEVKRLIVREYDRGRFSVDEDASAAQVVDLDAILSGDMMDTSEGDTLNTLVLDEITTRYPNITSRVAARRLISLAFAAWLGLVEVLPGNTYTIK